MLARGEYQTTTRSRSDESRITSGVRSDQQDAYPVIDLFAGPGGLGEGFASTLDAKGHRRFQSVVAVERDEFSHQTLLLRHFFRQFPDGEAPDDYYDFLAGRITRAELFARYPAAYADASRSTLRISLGVESHAHVRKIIRERLADSEQWALVGGPPCQAYSLAGRSRMMSRPDFEQDERHTLYLEYLRKRRASEIGSVAGAAFVRDHRRRGVWRRRVNDLNACSAG